MTTYAIFVFGFTSGGFLAFIFCGHREWKWACERIDQLTKERKQFESDLRAARASLREIRDISVDEVGD